jgi:hypothetical protein
MEKVVSRGTMQIVRQAAVAVGITAMSISLAALAATPASKTPRRFAPTSKWAMEYADDVCRLIRDFSDGRDSITLALERFAPGQPLSVGLAGSGIKARAAAKVARYAFAPVSGTLTNPLYTSQLSDGRTYYYIVGDMPLQAPNLGKVREMDMLASANIPADAIEVDRAKELEQVRGVEELQLLGGFAESVSLATGPLVAPMKAMQDCMDDLLTSWNIDAKAHRSLTRGTVPLDPRKLSAAFARSTATLADQRSQMIRFRMIVDPTGQPTKCEIAGPGGQTDLGRETCRTLLKEAKFAPARDANQQPIASFYLGRVRFETW